MRGATLLLLLLIVALPIYAAPPFTIVGNVRREGVATGGGFSTYYLSLGNYVEARGVVDAYGSFYVNGFTSFSEYSAPQFASANLTDSRRLISKEGGIYGWFEYTNDELRASSGFGFESPSPLSVYGRSYISQNSLNVGLDAVGTGKFVTGAVWYFSQDRPWDHYYEKYRLNGNFAASFAWNFTTPPTVLPMPTGRPATIALWPRS
ncbi:MAG: hypothetical protein B6U69_04135 [Thermofilum sp. ex4484_15]|nr:MAG: hypothetical protein B6U69_04135 [Thermofilum sp. ex4484_15]